MCAAYGVFYMVSLLSVMLYIVRCVFCNVCFMLYVISCVVCVVSFIHLICCVQELLMVFWDAAFLPFRPSFLPHFLLFVVEVNAL